MQLYASNKGNEKEGETFGRNPSSPGQHFVFIPPCSPATLIQMETYFYKAPITFHLVFPCVADYFQSYGCYQPGFIPLSGTS